MTRLFGDRVPSPIGTILLVWDEEHALRALDFEDHEARFQRLLRRHCGTDTPERHAAPVSLRHALDGFFGGNLRAIDAVAVRTNGTPFQRRVWEALRTIPAGRTRSYGELAAALDVPKGSRAVGLANGANPIAVVVPCHRVIGADGTLTGYGGGLSRKRWLLEHERRASA